MKKSDVSSATSVSRKRRAENEKNEDDVMMDVDAADAAAEHGNAAIEQPQDDEGSAEQTEAQASMRQAFPVARVRRIIKMDPDIDVISNDAVMLISKATRLLLEKFIWAAYEFTRDNKRKTVQYRDLVSVYQAIDEYFFLEDILKPVPHPSLSS